MTGVEQEVWQRVQALNRAWTTGRVQALGEFFHPDAVAITPMDAWRLEGRDDCVASWQRFVDSTQIHAWRESDPRVSVFGGACAVVTYYYEISFTLGGARQQEKGRDMFVLVRDGDRWLVVADQFSPFPT